MSHLADTIAAVFPCADGRRALHHQPGALRRRDGRVCRFAEKAAALPQRDLRALMGRVADGLVPYETHTATCSPTTTRR